MIFLDIYQVKSDAMYDTGPKDPHFFGKELQLVLTHTGARAVGEKISARQNYGNEHIAHLELLPLCLGVNCMDALLPKDAPMYKQVQVPGAGLDTLARWNAFAALPPVRTHYIK